MPGGGENKLVSLEPRIRVKGCVQLGRKWRGGGRALSGENSPRVRQDGLVTVFVGGRSVSILIFHSLFITCLIYGVTGILRKTKHSF